MKPLQIIKLQMLKVGEIFYDKCLTCTKDVFELARTVEENPDTEKVYLLGVDSSHTPIFLQLLSIGGMSECMVDRRNIFKSLLLANCTSFFLWHNHTSLAAPLKSSQEDRAITKILYQAGKVMGINLEDHLIVNDTTYHSILGELMDEGGLFE